MIRRTLEVVPPGRRREISKQRWMDYVNRDMRAIVSTEDEVMTELAGRELFAQRLHNSVEENVVIRDERTNHSYLLRGFAS